MLAALSIDLDALPREIAPHAERRAADAEPRAELAEPLHGAPVHGVVALGRRWQPVEAVVVRQRVEVDRQGGEHALWPYGATHSR